MENAHAKLAALEASGKHVFHGSGYGIENFEPRQANNYKDGKQIPDGKPAIYTSPAMHYAWFMAVINNINCPAGFHSSAGSRNGILTFRVTQHTLDQLNPNSKGYVYVFNKNEFIMRDENEYYSLQSKVPIERIEVKFGDFDAPIEVFK